MTTTAALLDQTRLKLGVRDALNKLNGALTTSEDSIVCEFATTGISAGMRVSVDLQDFHVWSKDDATKTLTVESIAGSDASHSDNALLRVNAAYSPVEILAAVNDELASLPGMGVVRHRTVTLTSSSTAAGYDLASVSDLLRVKKVAWEDTTRSVYVPVHRRYWRIDHDVPTDDFASGSALFISDPAVPAGRAIQVRYAAPFVALSLLTDDVAAVSFLPARAHPILPVAAAIRLTTGRSSARADLSAQGDTRRAEEVSTNDTRLAQTPLLAEYDRLLRAERRAQAMEGRE